MRLTPIIFLSSVGTPPPDIPTSDDSGTVQEPVSLTNGEPAASNHRSTHTHTLVPTTLFSKRIYNKTTSTSPEFRKLQPAERNLNSPNRNTTLKLVQLCIYLYGFMYDSLPYTNSLHAFPYMSVICLRTGELIEFLKKASAMLYKVFSWVL